MTLYRGDDTNAFGAEFITIELEDAPEGISKAEFRCGTILKIFENPTFPLSVALNSSESMQLRQQNECYLAIYDSEGRKRTCEGSVCFETQCRKV